MAHVGLKKPSQAGLKTYELTRSHNIRVYQKAVAQFASDEEAIEAAKHGHLDEVIDASGKAVEFEHICEDEPVMYDLSWVIDRVNMMTTVGVQHPKNLVPVVDGSQALKPGYVETAMVLELIDELGQCDPDWPGDIRKIRGLVLQSQDLKRRLDAQEG